MNKNAKRILVVTLNEFESGISKYRIYDPHVMLQNLFPNDFYVEFVEDYDILNTDMIKKFDAIFYHNALEQLDKVVQQTEIIKKLNIPIILDIDDFWQYHSSHMYYHYSKKIKLKERIINALKKATLITTTTQFFADKIKIYNKNVVVMPNAINFDEKQFQIIGKNANENKINIGYVAGVSHLEDISLLQGVLSSVKNKNTQMRLCGYNVEKEKAIQSNWYKMERKFTDNFKLKDENFIAYLHEFTTEPYHNQAEMEYQRLWTKSINSYMSLYDNLDICLAPLKDYEFNLYKSNLKMLEAGSKKKAIIASGIQPYLDGKHEKNCLLVEPRKDHKNWIKYVTKLVDSEQMRIDLGESLYEYVKSNFNLKFITEKRAEIYRKFI